jgi:mannose-6-phosphate isomerase-like protein (cupin superfamily)
VTAPALDRVRRAGGKEAAMEASIDAAARPYARAAGEGAAIWYVNNRATLLATAAQTGGAFGLVPMAVATGHGPPRHIHRAEDEAFYILAGRITVRCGDDEFAAGPGAFVYTPRGVPHTFRPAGDTPVRLLVLLTPGGGEGYFVDGGRPAAGPGMPPHAPPDLATLASVAVQYHQENIGPPLAPAAGK